MERALYFLDSGFWFSPLQVAGFLLTLFVIVLLRYLILAVFYNSTVKRSFEKKRFAFFRVDKQQWKKEIAWSACSSAIFTILASATFYLYQKGYTQVYTNISERSYFYFGASIVILLVLYETYYYWLHRWMHQPRVFKIVHKVHHDSVHTSVFTSFSFHPIEAILQFLFLPVVLMILPVHYYALGIVLILWTISAIINHAGIEIFPRNFNNHFIGRWMIGATHHDLHHKQFRNNFGLYFTFWDKWMKTESDRYPEDFSKNTEQKRI